jgi:Zn-dependent protease
VENGSPERAPAHRARSLWTTLAVLGGFVLAKAKLLLGLVKAAPLAKLGLTSVSMFAMVALEAQRAGLVFAVGFVLLILVHELGHGWAMRQAGIRAGWPIFIPFFGAFITMKSQPRSRAVEAAVAYGGPAAGTAASLVVAAVALALGWRAGLALAHAGFFLNLFNLLPLSPMDGGRIAQGLHRRAWVVGGLLMGGLFLLTQAPQLLLIGVLSLAHWRGKGDAPGIDPYTPAERRAWIIRYFGLIVFLAASIHFTQRLLGHR